MDNISYSPKVLKHYSNEPEFKIEKSEISDLSNNSISGHLNHPGDLHPMKKAEEIEINIEGKKKDSKEEVISDLLAINYLKACIVNFYLSCIKDSKNIPYLGDFKMDPTSDAGKKTLSEAMFLQMSKDLVNNEYYLKASKSLGSNWDSEFIFNTINQYSKIASINMRSVKEATAAKEDVLKYGPSYGHGQSYPVL